MEEVINGILIREVEAKNIMTKSSLPVGGYSVNPYVGCTHACKYCYASFMKSDMQEAFQKGFEDAFGKTDAVILPEKEIDQSVNAEGSAVYKAVVDGEMVGGAVVIINESTQHNHLDLLFVKNGVQSNGIGKKIWFELERIYPNTKVWETCTPYFDKRNIHFYVNVCGFHITEFFNEKHPMPDTPDDFVGDGNEGMFAFKKQMRL